MEEIIKKLIEFAEDKDVIPKIWIETNPPGGLYVFVQFQKCNKAIDHLIYISPNGGATWAECYTEQLGNIRVKYEIERMLKELEEATKDEH